MTRNLRRLAVTEADTLRAITDYLEAKKILYLRHNPTRIILNWGFVLKLLQDVWFRKLSALEALDKLKSAIFAKVPPSQLGAPDLIVFPGYNMNGMRLQPLAIEVKSPTGKVSDEQVAWAVRAQRNGIKYVLARRLEDVIEAMRQ